jgi:hypothetical protein
MKYLNSLALAIAFSTIPALTATAQTQPAPRAAETPAPAKKILSLGELAAGEKFTSEDGRFTVSLPKDGAQFEKLVPGKESPNEKGGGYTWIFKEGVISINYSDDPEITFKTEEDFADLAGGMKEGVTASGGTVLSENRVKLGENRGYEIKFVDSSKLKGITRMYIAGERRYTVLGLAFPDVPGGGVDTLTKALDTLEVTEAKPVK